MATKLPRIREKAKSEVLVLNRKETRYPVQQVASGKRITKKVVEEAVREINPDADSMEFRG